MTTVETPTSVLNFWFGRTGRPRVDVTGGKERDDNEENDAAIAARQAALWWRKDPATDVAIRDRFLGWSERAAAGELDPWAATAQGWRALIVLTDQFPRNMYRHTAQAFAFDAVALRWCRQGLARGLDQALRPIERVFAYLPLEHSEELADQNRAVALMRALAHTVPPVQADVFHGFCQFAERHQAVVARFGRFPHRNAAVGRPSTAEELAFLQTPGSSF